MRLALKEAMPPKKKSDKRPGGKVRLTRGRQASPGTADATDDNPSVKTFTLTPTQTLMTLIQTVMTLIQTLKTLTVEKNKSERPKKASIKLHRMGHSIFPWPWKTPVSNCPV